MGFRSEKRTVPEQGERRRFRGPFRMENRAGMRQARRRKQCGKSAHSSAAQRPRPHRHFQSWKRPFFFNKMEHKRTITRNPHKINRKSYFFLYFSAKISKKYRRCGSPCSPASPRDTFPLFRRTAERAYGPEVSPAAPAQIQPTVGGNAAFVPARQASASGFEENATLLFFRGDT